MKKTTSVGTEVLSITINSKELLSELLTVGKAINPNPVVAAIENAKVSIQIGKIQFTGDNFHQSITTTLPYNVIGDTGNFLLPHKKTVELLKALPNTPVSIIHTRENNVCSVQITADGKKFKLSSEPWEDFPKEKVFAGSELSIPASQIKEAFNVCLTTVSLDTLRPAQLGIHIQTETGDIVSCDGSNITIFRTGLSLDAKPFTISAAFARLVLESLSGGQENVTLEVSDKSARISTENQTITTQLIDERFVQYENAIPRNNPHVGTINLHEWSAAIRRALIFSNSSFGTRNTFTKGKLTLSTEDLDYGSDSTQEVEFEGEFEFEIGMQGKAISNILQKLNSQTARIEMSTPNRGICIYPDNTLANELLIVTMPVMLITQQ